MSPVFRSNELTHTQCQCSSGVEHFLGKEEVAGSNPAIGSNFFDLEILSLQPEEGILSLLPEEHKNKNYTNILWQKKNLKEASRMST